MQPTLDQLVVLDAIARTGSFARAAEALHRVPSAVSYSVRQLEEGLGLTLFDRSRRTAALTPAGERVLESGRDVLAASGALERLARELADGWESELRVVVDGALPMRPILRTLTAFQEPGIPTRVRLDVEHREGVLDRFERDRAHWMLVIGFDPGDDLSGLQCTALPELPLVLVAACGHPLHDTPTREAAAHHPELVVRDSSPSRVSARERSFLGSRYLIQLSDFHAKRLALLDGVGFGWVPEHLVSGELERGELVPLTLEGRGPRFVYSPQLVRRRDEPEGRAMRLFRDRIIDQ